MVVLEYYVGIYFKISKHMNVLILTPDAVGSTLLQRLITIYMQFHRYDKPVINLHELTNGLKKYHNTALNQEVLGKPDNGTQWGYYQSLREIVELLDSVDHYKTSRLAQYHIKNRQDPMSEQIPFYQYLNDNFYIISCRRHNVFEHALSWALNKVTKKLNVYSTDEKIEHFFDLYRNGIVIDPTSLIQTLETYKSYLEWCENHFNIASYFYYDQHLQNIESYILNLPIFAGQTQLISWQQQYGIDFNTWNRCHYLRGDIGSIALDHSAEFLKISNNSATMSEDHANFIKNYHAIAGPTCPQIQSIDDYKNLPQHIRNEVEQQFNLTVPETLGSNTQVTLLKQSFDSFLPTEHQNFLNQYEQSYANTNCAISDMVKKKIMITPPPIKKQTLAEKKYIVKNFKQCLEVYNKWVEMNPMVGNPVDSDMMDSFATAERNCWKPDIIINSIESDHLLSDQRPIGQ
jgi:hypothetical protein